MTEPIFDHDKLDVYCLSIDYVSASFQIAKELDVVERTIERKLSVIRDLLSDETAEP